MSEEEKPDAPNFREVQSCNDCGHSEGIAGRPGGISVKCLKYREKSTDWSIYNQYVCDGYEPMET